MARSIKLLIFANCAMFVLLKLAVTFGGMGAANWLVLGNGFWLRPWTLATYMLTDSGALNTLFNCLWLWLFGRMFLEIASPGQLLACYFIGGLCGAGLFILAAAAGCCPYPLMGASAAVLALVSYAGVRVPYMRVNLMLIGSLSFKWIAIIAVGLSLLVGIDGNVGGTIAHLGGAVGGAGYALFLRYRRALSRPQRRARQKTLDELLKKVQRSGYKSLSSQERRQLLDYSKKL